MILRFKYKHIISMDIRDQNTFLFGIVSIREQFEIVTNLAQTCQGRKYTNNSNNRRVSNLELYDFASITLGVLFTRCSR
jgi:hypothetical protein